MYLLLSRYNMSKVDPKYFFCHEIPAHYQYDLTVKVITKDVILFIVAFLAALSSSRTTVVGWSVRPSTDFCEKVTFRVSKGN